VAFLLGFIVLAPSVSADDGVKCERRDQFGNCIFTGGGDGGAGDDGGGRSEPPRAPQEGDTYVEEGLTSACQVMGPPGSPNGDVDCMGAHSCPDPKEYRYRVWNRTVTYTGGRWEPGPWQHVDTECRSSDEPDPVTEADVIREVEAFGLRPASAEINPANGRTLINFETVFYTTAAQYQFRLPNLGPGVDIIATPARYTWHFGDSQTKVTDEPGRPYPHMDITHEYANTGTRQVRVDVEYQVQWNAGGGWQTIAQTIPGQQGPSTPLTVLENDPVHSRNR
jgi:hypothetical protein